MLKKNFFKINIKTIFKRFKQFLVSVYTKTLKKYLSKI